MYGGVEAFVAEWTPPEPGFERGVRYVVAERPRKVRPGRSLAEVSPDVVDEWDCAANGEITPAAVAANSTWPARWVCRRNPEHRWEQPVDQRAKTAKGKRCPFCVFDDRVQERRDTARLGRLLDQLEELADPPALVFSARNPVPLEEAAAVGWWDWIWECPAGHGELVVTLNAVLGGYKCRACFTRDVQEHHTARIPVGVDVGDVFHLDEARPRSKEELRLAAELAQVLPVDFDNDAIRIRGFFYTQPFVTPDVLIPELRVAVEWDGGHHRPRRPDHDQTKDAALLDAGWRCIRVIRREVRAAADVVPAPNGLNLDTVAEVFSRIVEPAGPYAARLAAWRDTKRWQGIEMYAQLVARYLGES